jgi:hypothetical protein
MTTPEKATTITIISATGGLLVVTGLGIANRCAGSSVAPQSAQVAAYWEMPPPHSLQTISDI